MIPPPSPGPGSQRVFGSRTLSLCSLEDWSHCWTLRSLEGSFPLLLQTPSLSWPGVKRRMMGNAPNDNTNTAACDATATATTAISDINDTIWMKSLSWSKEFTVLFHFWAIFFDLFYPPPCVLTCFFMRLCFKTYSRVSCHWTEFKLTTTVCIWDQLKNTFWQLWQPFE